jgi:hypothetical protein
MTCESNKGKTFHSAQDKIDRKNLGLEPNVDTTPICYQYDIVPKEAWDALDKRQRKNLGL